MPQMLRLLFIALISAVLTSCGAPEPTPTLTPTPSNTPRPTFTLPPTWTPTVFVTNTPRPTLPMTPIRPTVTPVIRRTDNFGLLAVTPTGAPPTIAFGATFDAACRTFARRMPLTGSIADRQTDAQVSWTAVQGAEGYRVWLLSPSRRYVLIADTTETTIVFKRELFVGFGDYAWEVMPLRNGDRFCQSLTGIISVRFSN